MSLINDALKRAQKAQTQTPPPAPPNSDLRPAEPATYAWHGVGLLLPAALALVALLTLFLVWEMSRRGSVEVRASTAPRPETQAPVSPAISVESTPASPARSGPPGATTSASQNPTAPGTNAPVTEETAKPLPPKLQAVIYNPRNPSAVISGHTVFRGDRLGEFRVVKITPDSATLVGEGQTNLLLLEH